eukprot:GSChrysophyteH1.ASY1.ANO1.3030.1 assembled CDS
MITSVQFFVFLSALFGQLVPSGAKSNPIITLPNQNGLQLEGTSAAGVNRWSGIRYAKPPVGKLRWAPPPYDATELRSVCYQRKDKCGDSGCSEDCLFLNVFAGENANEEAKASGNLLPVAVFVHGGAYIQGSSNIYPGVQLVNYWDGKAIVVTINYRLNVFGFLGSEHLRKLDETDGSTGNQGIQDQRAAFEWVRDNIAAFGGDPSRVMIFGESAGAGSMSMHLSMKRSFGLYDRVILESGSFPQWSMRPMAHAEEIFSAFVSSTNCAVDDIACMQSLSSDQVNLAMAKIYSMDLVSSAYFPFSPTADGVEATTAAWITAANGGVNNVPILHGYNRDEGSTFAGALPKNATIEDVRAFWASYPKVDDSQVDELQQMYLEGKTYPDVSGYTQDGQVHKTQPVYQYWFEHVSVNNDLVAHASELPYVFHWSELLHKEDRSMADVLATYWGNFLLSENADPNDSHVGLKGLPSWPRVDSDTVVAMNLVDANNITSVFNPKKEECDFWIPFLNKSIDEDF